MNSQVVADALEASSSEQCEQRRGAEGNSWPQHEISFDI
jgi:hypothetical protein